MRAFILQDLERKTPTVCKLDNLFWMFKKFVSHFITLHKYDRLVCNAELITVKDIFFSGGIIISPLSFSQKMRKFDVKLLYFMGEKYKVC